MKEIIVRVWREETQALSNKQKKLHKTLEQLTERRNKVVEMLVSGEITVDEKKELVTKINNESSALQQDLTTVGSLSELKTDAIDYAIRFMSNAQIKCTLHLSEHQKRPFRVERVSYGEATET